LVEEGKGEFYVVGIVLVDHPTTVEGIPP
jgi:hypothetical protein